MKNISIVIFLFLSIQSFGQITKHSIKTGFQIGGTSHLGASGLGYHVQYDYEISDRFSAGIGFGQLHGKVTQRGASAGISGGVTWNTTYEIHSTEGYNYVEINGLYAYSKRWNFMELKFGGGVTFLSNWINYNKDVTILRGEIISSEETRRLDNVAMLNVVLDNNFNLTDRLFINGKFIFRKVINDQKPLLIETFYEGTGRGGSTSEVDMLGAVVIGLGYRF
ncbi:MAG: hypothetical protein AB8F94_04460 [Saprospiraceae bacterium]